MSARSTAPGPLVQPDWLRQHLHSPDVVVLQVDGDSTCYHTAHLPGALPLDWHDQLHDPFRRGVLPRTAFEQLLRCKGVRPETHVVLYGRQEMTYAAYAYWLLRYYGHEQLSLLDGGLRAWTRSGGRVVDEAPVAMVESRYDAADPDSSIRVGRDEVVHRYAGAPDDVVVLDCRSASEFAGRHVSPVDLGVEHHRVGGHVPGARNLPAHLLVGDDGRLLPPERLRELFAARGVGAKSDVVVYCRVAERSALLWFALSEVLGHPRVRHYDGGWSEYGSLIDVPVDRDELV